MKIARFLLPMLLAFCAAISARTAPDFSLPDSNGKQVKLSDYRGRWVVVEFIGVTRPHCREASKTLEELKTRFRDQFQVLGISVEGAHVSSLAAYRKELGLSYPLLQGNPKVAKDYLGSASGLVPAFFLISPSGEIVDEKHPERASDRDFYRPPGAKAGAPDDAWMAKNLDKMIREGVAKTQRAILESLRGGEKGPAAKKER